MHYKKDFVAYDRRASELGLSIMARIAGTSKDELADIVYDEFKCKLYNNLVRVCIEDAFPDIRAEGIDNQLKQVINDSYDQAKEDKPNEFLRTVIRTPATLIGVGAPTALFLGDVGRLLGAKVVSNEYSPVANALGAVVGNVSASMSMEIRYQNETDKYTVFGLGHRTICETRSAAKKLAADIAENAAVREAIERGADASTLEITKEEKENIVDTEFGSLYMGYKITVTASGKLRLN